MKLIAIRWIRTGVAAAAFVVLSSCGGDSSSPTPPLTITAASPPAGTTGEVYPGYSLMASGGTQSITWTESGSLPPGLALSTSGQFTGTPVTAGSYPILVAVADSSQPAQTAQTQVTLVIDDSPIVIAATPAPPAGIVAYPYPASGFSASPFGVREPSYPFGFSASGGSPPYTWQASGTVPPGLTLDRDGLLSGTPTEVGAFAFTVTVKDSAPTPGSSSHSFTISITTPPSPAIANSEVPTGMAGVVYAAFQSSVNGGLAPFVWTETGALDGLTLSSSGVLAGTPSAAGKFPITLEVTDAQNRAALALPFIVRVSLARSGAFTLTKGSLTVARAGHTATLLTTGKVLVAGGANGAADPSAELYDPKTEIFTTTGSMTEARIGHTATLLNVATVANFGKVLIVGVDGTADLYDPAAGTFTATGSMTAGPITPTATLLEAGSAKLGSVLIVGVISGAGDLTAELYNPATGTFSTAGSTNILRAGHTATQLLDGRVLIAGGGTKTAALYDPASGTFSATGSMTVARTGATATRLQDGTVLIFGADAFAADLYDPAAGTFTPVGSYALAAHGQTASLRPDGSVLAVGGYDSGGAQLPVSVAALFGPESGGFTVTGALNTSRGSHTATVLADGTVLIVGGIEETCFLGCDDEIDTTILSSAERYE